MTDLNVRATGSSPISATVTEAPINSIAYSGSVVSVSVSDSSVSVAVQSSDISAVATNSSTVAVHVDEAPISVTAQVGSAGGGGGVTDHGALSGLGDDDHTQYVRHNLSTAINDFLLGSGSNTWIKKTLAETITILRTSLDSVYAAIANGVTNGDSHDHAGGDGAQIDHGGLAGLSDDDHPQYIKDSEFTQDSGVLVGTGAGTFAEETGATLRTSLGLAIGTDVLAPNGDGSALTGIDYSVVSGNDAATNVTGAEMEELSDGSETTLHSHAGSGQYRQFVTVNDSSNGWEFVSVDDGTGQYEPVFVLTDLE